VHIAGSVVETGNLKKGSSFRVLRDEQVVFTLQQGATLRHFQEEVGEVRHGTECGVGLGSYTGLLPGDKVECFTVVETPQTLE
jgi:translation initiation factor IF-2